MDEWKRMGISLWKGHIVNNTHPVVVVGPWRQRELRKENQKEKERMGFKMTQRNVVDSGKRFFLKKTWTF